jgi:c-di-GMP-binding flagellar brake protein YcgR
MQTFENIDGTKLLSIFQQLERQKILVKVSLPKIDFESLTLVTETAANGKQQSFNIAPPKGLIPAIAEIKADRLSFEFTSSDHVIHRFASIIDAISEQTIVLRYPAFIQRHQQRDNFRLKVPYDSYAQVQVEDTQIRLEIDNISLGGVYCFCPNKYKALITPDLELADMQLFWTLKDNCCTISVQRCVVKRLERRHRPKHFGVAFEFVQVKRDARKSLVQQIYELQRSFLQNRLKVVE